MNEHFSEADLLETYYTQPGESVPVMMHLAQCAECAARYEKLEQKLRGLAACHTEKPEAFWDAQRSAVMRRIGQPGMRGATMRIAAAALLALVLGGIVIYQNEKPVAPAAVRTATVEPQPIKEIVVPSDPWESDELKEFGAVVEWESWVAEGEKKGDKRS